MIPPGDRPYIAGKAVIRRIAGACLLQIGRQAANVPGETTGKNQMLTERAPAGS
jgi:hypothetical protein